MESATCRFYEELNDYLPRESRKVDSSCPLGGASTAGEMIDARGVPRALVELILVNGEPSGFDRLLRHGDKVSVYPVFVTFDLSKVRLVREHPLRRLRFVLHSSLAGLAVLLCQRGIDAAATCGDDELLHIARDEPDRVVLSGDPGFLEAGGIQRGYQLTAQDAGAQLIEVLQRFQLE